MLGRTHALSGVLAGIATADLATPEPVSQTAWVAIVGGAALIPDIDMPGTTIARMWGPLTGGHRLSIPLLRVRVPGIAHAVKYLAGGHRKGTHSLPGIATAALLVWAASLWTWTTAVAVAAMTGIAILAVDFCLPGRIHWRENLAASATAALVAHTNGWTLPGWVPLAVAAGMIVHCLGDEVTHAPVHWAWPFHTRATPPRDDRSWWRFRTGGRTESVVLAAIVAAIPLLLAYRAGYSPLGSLADAFNTFTQQQQQ